MVGYKRPLIVIGDAEPLYTVNTHIRVEDSKYIFSGPNVTVKT